VERLREANSSIKQCVGVSQSVDHFDFVAVEQTTLLEYFQAAAA
jgi:hypothetical protein